MNVRSDFFQESMHSAAVFLQTAVIIDDRIFSDDTRHRPKKLKETIGRKPAVKNKLEASDPTITVDSPEQDPHAVIPQDLISSFAKKQIVCSTYQPKSKNFSTGSGGEFRKLCKNADIVIVDWSLHGDDGQHALELITGLALDSSSEAPEQLRLILTYTGEPNLFEVANRIFERLNELSNDLPKPEDRKRLAIRVGGSRIVVLGKKNGRERLEEFRLNEVNEIDLADRAIEEFTHLTAGLMSNVALSSLAALRHNARKILSRFTPDLDAAFLHHRILSMPDDDAESHLLDMMTSELRAVIEDHFSPKMLSDEIITLWRKAMLKKFPNSNDFSGDFPKDSDFKDEFLKLYYKGAGCFTDIKKHPFKRLTQSNAQGHTQRGNLTRVLSQKDNYEGDMLFANIMTFRTFYTSEKRTITTGTLLFGDMAGGNKEDQSGYWLCIQPACDTVRLKKNIRFPLLKCYIEQLDGKTKGERIVVFENGKAEGLVIRLKTSEIRTAVFKPGKTGKIVSKIDAESGSYLFNTIGGRKYRWVAELKFEHAQRIVKKISDVLSRIGLAESEWLRLHSK